MAVEIGRGHDCVKREKSSNTKDNEHEDGSCKGDRCGRPLGRPRSHSFLVLPYREESCREIRRTRPKRSRGIWGTLVPVRVGAPLTSSPKGTERHGSPLCRLKKAFDEVRILHQTTEGLWPCRHSFSHPSPPSSPSDSPLLFLGEGSGVRSFSRVPDLWGFVHFPLKCYTLGDFHKLLSRQPAAKHIVGQNLYPPACYSLLQ